MSPENTPRLSIAPAPGNRADLPANMQTLLNGAANAPMNVATPSPRPAIYYAGPGYYLDGGDKFVPIDQSSVARHLKASGLSSAEVDLELNRIQTECFVSYAGPLAGHQRGYFESGGKGILVTFSPKIIQPSVGTWCTLRAVIEGLLVEENGDRTQFDYFLGWLKVAREALVAGQRRPGQALVLAGPRNCGKSLLIDVIEMALGGRRANPHPNFSGRTNFNGDLAGAELLAVDDEAGSTDIRARRHLAASIKSNLFSGAVRIEGKHREAISIRPFWRVVLACNDEPEALMVIPPLTEDVADKLTLLRCRKQPLPMPAHSLEERDAFFATLTAEVPAMLSALDAWEIPAELVEERCGVGHYHHPDLVHALEELAPESHLLALVDMLAEAGFCKLPWTGRAAELKNMLIDHELTRREAERLLQWTPSTGHYLARIGEDRVRKLGQRNGIQTWEILPVTSEE